MTVDYYYYHHLAIGRRTIYCSSDGRCAVFRFVASLSETVLRSSSSLLATATGVNAFRDRPIFDNNRTDETDVITVAAINVVLRSRHHHQRRRRYDIGIIVVSTVGQGTPVST